MVIGSGVKKAGGEKVGCEKRGKRGMCEKGGYHPNYPKLLTTQNNATPTQTTLNYT